MESRQKSYLVGRVRLMGEAWRQSDDCLIHGFPVSKGQTDNQFHGPSGALEFSKQAGYLLRTSRLITQIHVGFEILTAVVMKSTRICLPLAFTLVNCSPYLFDPEDGGDMFLRNVS
jgi:hypothetical protein